MKPWLWLPCRIKCYRKLKWIKTYHFTLFGDWWHIQTWISLVEHLSQQIELVKPSLYLKSTLVIFAEDRVDNVVASRRFPRITYTKPTGKIIWSKCFINRQLALVTLDDVIVDHFGEALLLLLLLHLVWYQDKTRLYRCTLEFDRSFSYHRLIPHILGLSVMYAPAFNWINLVRWLLNDTTDLLLLILSQILTLKLLVVY